MTERLGEVLIQLGALRPEDLQRALRTQQERGGRIGEVLLSMSLVDEDTLLKALARKKRIPFAEARWFDSVEPRIIKLVPKKVAMRSKLVPLRLMEKKLVVATCDADNLDRTGELQDMLGHGLRPVLARRTDVDRALGRYYRDDDGPSYTPAPASPQEPVQLLMKKKDPGQVSNATLKAVKPTARPGDPLPFTTLISPRPTAPPGQSTEELIRGEQDLELRELFANKDTSPPFRASEDSGVRDTGPGGMPAFEMDASRTLLDAKPLLRSQPLPMSPQGTMPEATPLLRDRSRQNVGDASSKELRPVVTSDRLRPMAPLVSFEAAEVSSPRLPSTPPRRVSTGPAITLSTPPPAAAMAAAAAAAVSLAPASQPPTPAAGASLSPTAAPPGEGEKFGQYTLTRRIKAGGMAEVFLAKTGGVEGFEKRVAIKRILPHLTEGGEFVDMFIDEAKLTVQLNHANIAHIYDFGKRDNTYYIAMEYIHGRDVNAIFKEAYKRKTPLPVPLACFIIQQVCEGLDYAHRKKGEDFRDLGIVHRDVSPANILVSFEGAVKIIDFGIAKAVSKLSMTRPGLIKGKISYMSPEQMRGQPIDRRSDVFAVGIILYELLAGRRLFAAKSDVDTIRNVIKGNIPPLEGVRPDVPPELAAIVLKALERDPDQRFNWASDMAAALQAFMMKQGMTQARSELAAHMQEFLRDEP